ncbi:hypothetical protein BVRB_015370 [Beta vulgaris subsp. vulgaris]|uniref:F-box domain-containing protein n=1 Tax=Beta vulgaris subsp. vulgaris TaxID=3555 RepID=A0A0J8B4J8_BETVV|nr:hypothetical protein BVRB_015370 [Beta vulgaris subsp. vulgaris]
MSAFRISRKRKATADRISNLPENITQKILECLPLQEAARTSVLSSHWRHKWAASQQLVLDEKLYTSILKNRTETTDISLAYSKTVNDILLSHVGPIWKFVLYLPSWFPKETDISQWIRYVHANGVKEFTLGDARGPEKCLPYSLFSCKDLTHLTLIKCQFPPLPPTFRGFPRLISLRWETPSLTSDTCKEVNVLETLTSKCPELQSLCLSFNFREWENLCICAPKLQELFMDGRLSKLSLEGTTLIKKLALDLSCMKFQHSKHMSDFFSTLPKVEKLILKASFWMSMKLWEFTSPRKFPKGLDRLRTLKVIGIPVHCRFSNSLLLCLFLSSPPLERLYIEASEHEVSDEQPIQIDDTCILPCLRNIQLVGISGFRRQLQLIKFLLACSPALEEMSIELSMEMGGAQEKFHFVTELLQYCRASPTAKVIIKTKRLSSVRYTFSPIWLE